MLTKSILIVSAAAFVGGSPIFGTTGDDDIDGNARDEVIHGLAGNDDINGGPGDDILNGGADNDFLFGDIGNDLLHGGPGDDLLRGFMGDDRMYGGDGNDIIDLWEDAGPALPGLPCLPGTDVDVAFAGLGDDIITWGSGLASAPGVPLQFCIRSGNCEANGGPGFDTIFMGVGLFLCDSSEYVIETGTQPGFTHQIRALTNGATLNLRNVEAVEFGDQVIMLD